MFVPILNGTGLNAAPDLSKEDAALFEQALSSFNRLSDIWKEHDLPFFLEAPQKADFVDARARAHRADLERQARVEAFWADRLPALRPVLRIAAPPDSDRSMDTRAVKVRSEEARLRQIAAKRRADLPELEKELDRQAHRVGVKRRVRLPSGKVLIFAGLNDRHEPVWATDLDLHVGASASADRLWPQNRTPWTVNSTGLNLSGTGVLLGIWEVGGAVRTTHLEFLNNRITQVDDDTNDPIPLSGHATAVAGVMAAAGTYNFGYNGFVGRHMHGVAYNANVDSYDSNDLTAELSTATSTPPGGPAGLRYSNHSWGLRMGWGQSNFQYRRTGGSIQSGTFWVWFGDANINIREDWRCGAYESYGSGQGAADFDEFMHDAPRHLAICAAANDRLEGPGQAVNYVRIIQDFNNNGTLEEANGEITFFDNPGANERDWSLGDGDVEGFDTIGQPATAKNVLTVGSVRDVFHTLNGDDILGFAPGAQVTISEFSSRGPTDDGRIKPDIVAVGERNLNLRAQGLVTPHTIDNAQFGVGWAGTSFAAPAVTGGIGLAKQRRNQLFPNLDPTLDDLRASTWKCLAIHTADDIGTPGPDYRVGYGLFNALSLVEQVELDAADGRGSHIREFELSPSEHTDWLVTSDGTEPLRVTIAWTDPAGIPSSQVDDMTPDLVNNIDLIVDRITGGSVLYRPWILNPDLALERETVRDNPATTGVDNRNTVEQIVIANPAAETYRIRITHAGGVAGSLVPTAQWVSVVTSGDTPPVPEIIDLEKGLSGIDHLVHVETGPGEHLRLEYTDSMEDPQSWQTAGTLTTEPGANVIPAANSGNARFWRLER